MMHYVWTALMLGVVGVWVKWLSFSGKYRTISELNRSLVWLLVIGIWLLALCLEVEIWGPHK